MYINSDKDIEVIYKEIDEQIEKYLNEYNDKLEYYDKLKSIKSTVSSNKVPFLGESYKSTLIDLFIIFEELNTKYDNSPKKKDIINKEITKYINNKKEETLRFLIIQLEDTKEIEYYMNELFLGYNGLDYTILNNLYNTFTNSIDLVCPEIESSMLFTIRKDKRIFNEDGSINKDIYDFSYLEKIYNYAIEHKKLIKLNTIINNVIVPINLIKEINDLENHKKRDYLLRFIEDYVNEISIWATRHSYDFRQIEVIDNIASPTEESMLRNSFWSENIGTNPDTGDNYYIDILKIVRNRFNFSELIISDYDEFDTSKCDRICGVVKDIQEKNKRDNINYIDALGLKSHYKTFIVENDKKEEVTNTSVYKSMYEYKKLKIVLYRTEIDFKRYRYDTDIYNHIIDSRNRSDKESVINGYIVWGNSSKLTTSFCEGMNSHPIDGKGKETKEFKLFRDKVDELIHKYNANNKFNEQEYINEIINYAFRESNNLVIKTKDKDNKVNEIYNFYYDTFNKLIEDKPSKKNVLALEKLKLYLKNSLTIGCTTKEEFKNAMILFNENSNNVDIDKVVEEFKLTLIGNKIEIKKSNKFNKILIGYCAIYVILSITCIAMALMQLK